MANPWFKMHADFYADPKVQSMREAMQRRLLMLFCLRCSNELESLTDDEVACALRISARQWQLTKQVFIDKGFIDENLCILNWEKRQHITEDGKTPEERSRELTRQRTRQWRMRKQNGCADGSEDAADIVTQAVTVDTSQCDADVTVDTSQCDADVTSPKRHVTLPETETETETEDKDTTTIDVTPLRARETVTSSTGNVTDASQAASPVTFDEPEKIPDQAPRREVQIAVLLKRNGADPASHPSSKGIAEMVAQNLTDTEILLALQTAKQNRQVSGSQQAIGAAYVLSIAKGLRQDKQKIARSPPPQTAAQRRSDWGARMASVVASVTETVAAPRIIDMGVIDASHAT